MNELGGDFADDGRYGVRWGEGVDGLGECDEDRGNTELVVC